MRDKNLLERCGHGAATLSVSSECLEVMFFGGQNDFLYEAKLADTAVLRFGRFYKLYYDLFNICECFCLLICNICPILHTLPIG